MNKFWWEDRPQRSLTEMALDIVCTFCGQQPGSWCRTMAGCADLAERAGIPTRRLWYGDLYIGDEGNRHE